VLLGSGNHAVVAMFGWNATVSPSTRAVPGGLRMSAERFTLQNLSDAQQRHRARLWPVARTKALPEDDEAVVAQALNDAGGPAELAPQLVAITNARGLLLRELTDWISWHKPASEWSAQAWTRHCERVCLAAQLLEQYRRWKGECE
jgi:hypothetical protein